MALGTMQIVASLLVGACWFLMGVGVAMCTDAGPNPRCSRIFSLWGWAGASVLLSMLGGAALMAGGQAARGTRCGGSVLVGGVRAVERLNQTSSVRRCWRNSRSTALSVSSSASAYASRASAVRPRRRRKSARAAAR